MFHVEVIMNGVKNRKRSKIVLRTISLSLYEILAEVPVKSKIKFEKKSKFFYSNFFQVIFKKVNVFLYVGLC